MPANQALTLAWKHALLVIVYKSTAPRNRNRTFLSSSNRNVS